MPKVEIRTLKSRVACSTYWTKSGAPMDRSFFICVWPCRKIIWTTDISLEIAAICMVFKAMSLDKTINWCSIVRKGRGRKGILTFRGCKRERNQPRRLKKVTYQIAKNQIRMVCHVHKIYQGSKRVFWSR